MLQLQEKGKTKEEIRAQSWACPHCGAPLTPRLGLLRSWHFAHVKQADCAALRELEFPETPQHLAMKRALAQKLVELYGGKAAFEVALPQAGRIADVLVTAEHGHLIAGEAQYSTLTFERLQERTQSYLDAGIDVVWAFEETKALRQNSAWHDMREWLLELGLPVMLANLTYTEQPL